MDFKQFVSRIQIGALAVGAIFVVLLFTGWPGDSGGVSEGPDTSTPDVLITTPDTSEVPAAVRPDVSIAPDTSGPDTSTG